MPKNAENRRRFAESLKEREYIIEKTCAGFALEQMARKLLLWLPGFMHT